MAPMSMLTWLQRSVHAGPKCVRACQHGRLAALLLVLPPIATAASCQAILGINEGKARPSESGGAGGAASGGGSGGRDAGHAGGGSGGSTPDSCLEMEEHVDFHWAMAIGGPGADMASDVAVGRDGTIAVIGEFESDYIVVGDTGTAISRVGHENNGFIVKLSGGPTLQWTKRLWSDSGSPVIVSDVHYLDTNIAVAGQFFGDLKLDDAAGGEVTDVAEGPAAGAGFVLLLEAGGEVRANLVISATSGARAEAVATNEQQQIVVAGSWSGQLSIGEDVTTPPGVNNAFVALYGGSPMGPVSLATFPSGSFSAASVVTKQLTGDRIITGGQFIGDLSPPSGEPLAGSAGHENGWLSQLSFGEGTVTVHSTTQYGDPPDAGAGGGQGADPLASVVSVAAGEGDESIVSVCFEGLLDFDGAPVPVTLSGRECLVAVLDGSLALSRWAPEPVAAGLSSYLVNAIAAGAEGEIAFGGGFSGSGLEFVADKILPASVLGGAFAVVFHPDETSTYHYGVSIVGERASSVNGMSMDRCGNTVAVGTFDPGESVPANLMSPDALEWLLVGNGQADAFVMVLGAPD